MNFFEKWFGKSATQQVIDGIRARGPIIPVVNKDGVVIAYGVNEEIAQRICKLWNENPLTPAEKVVK